MPNTSIITRAVRMLCDPVRLVKRIYHAINRIVGRDITNNGERVDIIYNGHIDFNHLDMYQKSHFRRYEFACNVLDCSMVVGDMACGTGYGSAMISRTVRHAHGYDISPVLEVIKKRYHSFQNLEFTQCDILQIKGRGIFDAIISFETVEHFPSDLVPSLLCKFNSLLKEGGKLIISTPFNQEETDASRVHHRSFGHTEESLGKWFEASGFVVDKFFYQNYVTHEIRDDLVSKDFIIALCTKQAGGES